MMAMDTTGKKPSTPPQTCAVCGETSHQVAIHYARLLCNGCRAFFKRTVQGKMKVTECKLRGECKVNPASRKDCKPCRYQACLKAGVDINKVQPARETSAESMNKERMKDDEDEEDKSRRIQSRLETLPPLFPEHFQYPAAHINPHYHHHHHAYSHHATMTTTPTTTTSSSSSTPTAVVGSMLYPVPFFNPLVHPHHPHHHHHQYTPSLVPSASNNNGCRGNGGVVVPKPLTAGTSFNSFNVHISNTGNDHNSLYHHPRFSTTPSPLVFPFHPPTPQKTILPTSRAQDTKNFPKIHHPQALKMAPRQANYMFADNRNSHREESNVQSVIQPSETFTRLMGPQQHEASSSSSVLDFRNHPDFKPFSTYDVTSRSKVNSFTSGSSGSLATNSNPYFTYDNNFWFPVPSYLGYGEHSTHPSHLNEMTYNRFLAPYSRVEEKQNPQKSSAFMIDTLLEQNADKDNNIISSSTHNPETTTTTHQQNTLSGYTEQVCQTIKQELSDENDSGHVSTTNSDINVEMATTTPRSPSSVETNENRTADICVDLKEENSCSNTSQISKIMSPIHNDGEDDDCEDDDNDNIFLHPNIQPSSNEEESSTTKLTISLTNQKCSGIFRDRLTSTPNQRKHSPRDSPEVELNVVDITNTPSPINNTSDSEDGHDEHDGFESQQQETDAGVSRNVLSNSDSIPHANDHSSDPETKSENTEDNQCESESGLRMEESVSEKDGRTGVHALSQNSCSRVESDDSGMVSGSHSSVKSSTLSSSSSVSKSSNIDTSGFVTPFKSEKNNSPEELSSLDQDDKKSSRVAGPDTDNDCESNLEDSTSSNHCSNYRNTPSSNVESRGSCPTVSLKQSTPRKWKRFSSNENLPLVDAVNSPKRVKVQCSSSDVTSPTKPNVSETVSSKRNLQYECRAEEKQSVLCREKLSEIKNFENCLEEKESNHKDGLNISTHETPSDSLSVEKETTGDNRVFTDAARDTTGSVPLETDSISTFLDSIIQRIRNANSEADVTEAKKDLEKFYCTSDVK